MLPACMPSNYLRKCAVITAPAGLHRDEVRFACMCTAQFLREDLVTVTCRVLGVDEMSAWREFQASSLCTHSLNQHHM